MEFGIVSAIIVRIPQDVTNKGEKQWQICEMTMFNMELMMIPTTMLKKARRWAESAARLLAAWPEPELGRSVR
jgi:hypothetical protein